MRGGVANEDETRVVGDVQVLVRVGRPRLGECQTRRVPAQLRRRGRPHAERSIDVQPATVRTDGGGDVGERIERAAVHVARLRADDRRARDGREHVAQQVGAHAALRVRGDAPHARSADAEHLQGRKDRDVAFVADDDVDRRRAGKAVLLYVPATRAEYGVTRGRERGEARHRRAGREADARAFRQREEIDEPARDHGLDDRRGGRIDVKARVLVPRAREPVRRERRREASADDEPEVARAGGRDDPRIGGRRETRDDDRRVLAAVGQRAAERGVERRHVDPSADGPVADTAEERDREVRGATQHRGEVGSGGIVGSWTRHAAPQASRFVSALMSARIRSARAAERCSPRSRA